MNEALAWLVPVGQLVVPLLAILGFWIKISERLTTALTSAQAASILSAALQIKVETQQRELADYRVEAAEKFVSNKELFHTEERFRGLVEEIKRDIRGVTERLDRVLEGHVKK